MADCEHSEDRIDARVMVRKVETKYVNLGRPLLHDYPLPPRDWGMYSATSVRDIPNTTKPN